MLTLDNVPHAVISDISLEEVLQGNDNIWLFGLGIGDKFLKFFVKQLVFALKLLDQAVSLLNNLPQRKPAVNANRFAEFLQRKKLLRLVHEVSRNIINNAVPIALRHV